MRQRTSKDDTKFIFCQLSTTGLEAYTPEWVILPLRPFANGYLLEIASSQGLRHVSTSFKSTTPSGADQCRTMHTAPISISPYILWSCRIYKALFAWCTPSLLSLTLLLPPLLYGSLRPKGRYLMEAFWLGLSVFSNSVHIDWLCAYGFVPIY